MSIPLLPVDSPLLPESIPAKPRSKSQKLGAYRDKLEFQSSYLAERTTDRPRNFAPKLAIMTPGLRGGKMVLLGGTLANSMNVKSGSSLGIANRDNNCNFISLGKPRINAKKSKKTKAKIKKAPAFEQPVKHWKVWPIQSPQKVTIKTEQVIYLDPKTGLDPRYYHVHGPANSKYVLCSHMYGLKRKSKLY